MVEVDTRAEVREAVIAGGGDIGKTIEELEKCGFTVDTEITSSSVQEFGTVWCTTVDMLISFERTEYYISKNWSYTGTGGTIGEAYDNAIRCGFADYLKMMCWLYGEHEAGDLSSLISNISSYINRYLEHFDRDDELVMYARVRILNEIAKINDGSPDFRKIEDVKTAEKVLKMLKNSFKIAENGTK